MESGDADDENLSDSNTDGKQLVKSHIKIIGGINQN